MARRKPKQQTCEICEGERIAKILRAFQELLNRPCPKRKGRRA